MTGSVRVVASGPDGPGGRVTVATSLRHRCPFHDEIDIGQVAITWSVEDCTFELHDLATYLGSFEALCISHEDLTGRIFRHLNDQDIAVVNVTTTWSTAGMEVTVSRSRADEAAWYAWGSPEGRLQ